MGLGHLEQWHEAGATTMLGNIKHINPLFPYFWVVFSQFWDSCLKQLLFLLAEHFDKAQSSTT